MPPSEFGMCVDFDYSLVLCILLLLASTKYTGPYAPTRTKRLRGSSLDGEEDSILEAD